MTPYQVLLATFGNPRFHLGSIMLQHALLALLLLVVCLAVTGPPALAQDATIPGVTHRRPSEGRSVEIDGKFMVPYVAAIPGTAVKFAMQPIPGGTFLLGSPEDEKDRGNDEGAQMAVRVEPFWMSETEVTWGQYRRFMELYDLFKDVKRRQGRQVDDTNRVDAITAPTPLYDPTFTFALGESPDHPAVTMTPYAARQFSKWLSLSTNLFYRLPSEAEWEYACRAGTTTAFSFGDNAELLGEFAWYFDNSDDTYHAVRGKKPNAWGLHDMHGNVAELVIDQYDAEGYRPNEARQGARNAVDLIRWPTEPLSRVVRGGSWNDDPPAVRSAARGTTDDWRAEDPNFPKSPWWFTDEEALMVGFRLMRPYDVPAIEVQRRFWDDEPADVLADVQNRLDEGRGVLGLVEPGSSELRPVD